MRKAASFQETILPDSAKGFHQNIGEERSIMRRALTAPASWRTSGKRCTEQSRKSAAIRSSDVGRLPLSKRKRQEKRRYNNVLIGLSQQANKLVFEKCCHCETSAHTGRGNPPVLRNQVTITTKKRSSSHYSRCLSVHFPSNRGIATTSLRTGLAMTVLT